MKVPKTFSQSKHEQRRPTKRHTLNTRRERIQNLLNKPTSQHVSPATTELEPQLTHRFKRRGKLQVKPVSVKYENISEERKLSSAQTLPHVHTNGATELENSSSSEDLQEWNSYAKSFLQNDTGSSAVPVPDPEQVEKDEFQYHAQLDHIQNRAVLVLKRGQALCFRGKCLLTCLYGHVEVLGFTIEQGQQPYQLFSPPSHCPLTISALELNPSSRKNRTEGRLEARAIVRKHLTSEPCKRLMSEVDSDSCVILLEPLDTPLTRFLSSCPGLSEIFGLTSLELKSQAAVCNAALSAVGVTALRDPCAQGLVMSPSYREALSSLLHAWAGEFDRCPVILLCGAKNSGKSTFSRHLINSLLNHTACVDYLECDLGQTEFTPPGCLSLNTITDPLLGPAFTHLQDPQHMRFYGQADCSADVVRYLESLKSLWHHCSGENPVIINTMGWVKGQGFQILIDLIRLFSVTHVVQLTYGDVPQCPLLTPDLLKTAHGWQTHPPAPPTLTEASESHTPQSHVFLHVHSEFQTAGIAGKLQHQRSNTLRDLALLSYFSKLQSPDSGPVRPLHCFIPYQVSLSSVAVAVTHCEVSHKHILYAANANLVGLCCLSEKVTGKGGPVVLSQTPICQCVGLGVLRGVDVTRGLYFLVSPVPPSVLKHVNCLLLGEITLPKHLLTTQHGVETDLPYVTSDYSYDVTGAGKIHIYKGLLRACFKK